MGKILTVNSGISNLPLPDGNTYTAGQQVVLTDAEYSGLSGTVQGYLTVVATTTDPNRGTGSVGKAQSSANTAIGLAIVLG